MPPPPTHFSSKAPLTPPLIPRAPVPCPPPRQWLYERYAAKQPWDPAIYIWHNTCLVTLSFNFHQNVASNSSSPKHKTEVEGCLSSVPPSIHFSRIHSDTGECYFINTCVIPFIELLDKEWLTSRIHRARLLGSNGMLVKNGADKHGCDRCLVPSRHWTISNNGVGTTMTAAKITYLNFHSNFQGANELISPSRVNSIWLKYLLHTSDHSYIFHSWHLSWAAARSYQCIWLWYAINLCFNNAEKMGK